MSGCQKNKTEIMLDGQDTVSESETQDDTQAGNDATEDLAEAKISAEAELSEMPVETEPEMIFVVIQQPVFFHAAQFRRHGAALHCQIIRQLLPVKGNGKNSTAGILCAGG